MNPYYIPGLTSSNNLYMSIIRETVISYCNKNMSKLYPNKRDKYIEVTEESIQGRSRKRENVTARQLFCYVARLKTPSSYSYIGSYIGNRDHATVMHSIKTVESLMSVDQDYRETVIRLLSRYDANNFGVSN